METHQGVSNPNYSQFFFVGLGPGISVSFC